MLSLSGSLPHPYSCAPLLRRWRGCRVGPLSVLFFLVDSNSHLLCILCVFLFLSFLCPAPGDFWADLSTLKDPSLVALSTRLRQVIILDKAPSTVRAYLAAFTRWHRWATSANLPSFPARAPHVALYLLQLAQSSASCSSATQASAALHWIHVKADVDDPTSHPVVKQLGNALRRLYSRPRVRRSPLSPTEFRRIVAYLACSETNLADLQTAVIFVLGFCGFLRWDDMAGLRRESVSFSPTHATIHFEKRKNYQLRDCEDLVIARCPSALHLCPVAILERFFTLGNHLAKDPLLRKVTVCRKKGSYLRGVMSYTRALELVREALERTGINSAGYGTHSLRAGGATAAARAHVAERLIQRHGGWKTATAKDGYISDSLSDALSVSQAVLS